MMLNRNLMIGVIAFVALFVLYTISLHENKKVTMKKVYDLRNGAVNESLRIVKSEDQNSFQWLYSDLDHVSQPCNNSTITGYELPLLPTQPNCPNEYLLFDTVGEFNNVLRCFITALIYAAATHRTVILHHRTYNYTSLLNWTNLCAVEMTLDQITRLYQQTQYPKPIPLLFWGEYLQDANPMYGHLPFVNYSFQVYPYGGKNRTNRINVHCVSPLLPHFPHNTLIHTGSTYYSGVPKSTYMSVLKHLEFVDKDLREVERFITNTLKNKTYIGIHLRGFDGYSKCEARNPYNKNVCSMSWEYVSEIIKIHGYNPDTVPIFLATDKQNMNDTERLLAHPNVHLWNETEGGEHYNSWMIDMCLLSIPQSSSVMLEVPFHFMYHYGVKFEIILKRQIPSV